MRYGQSPVKFSKLSLFSCNDQGQVSSSVTWGGSVMWLCVCVRTGSTMSSCLEFQWRTSLRQSDWYMETRSWPMLWFSLLSQTRYVHTDIQLRCVTLNSCTDSTQTSRPTQKPGVYMSILAWNIVNSALFGYSFSSPFVNNPSCSFQPWLLTLTFLSSSLFLSPRMGKEAMRSGGWKTPGAMTEGTKVTNTLLHFSYFSVFFFFPP